MEFSDKQGGTTTRGAGTKTSAGMIHTHGGSATLLAGRKPLASARGGNTFSALSSKFTPDATPENTTRKINERTQSERPKYKANRSVDGDEGNVEDNSTWDKDEDTHEAKRKDFYRANRPLVLALTIAVIAIAIAFYTQFISIPYSKQGKPLIIDPEHFSEVQEFITDFSKRLSSVESSLQDIKQLIARIEGFEKSLKNLKAIVYKDDIANLVEKKELEDRVRESEHDFLNQISARVEEVNVLKDEFLKFKDEVGVKVDGIMDIQKEQKELKADVVTLEEKLREQSQAVEKKNDEMAKQISQHKETQRGLNVSVGNLVSNVTHLAEKIKGISIETLVLDRRTEDIKENIFDKGSLILVIMIDTILLVLMLVYLVANRDNNRHVNRNIDIEVQQGNGRVNHSPALYSTAGRILSQVRSHPRLERNLCIISFYEETHPLHMRMTQSVTQQLNLEPVEFITRRHEDILNIPPVSLYFLFVDFNERNVILEEPTLGLGDLRLTTVQAVQRMGGRIVIFYVRDQNSRQLDPAQLYNEDLASVTRQRELSALNRLSRFISAYDQLTDFQKAHLRRIVVDELMGH